VGNCELVARRCKAAGRQGCSLNPRATR
jgi:hypothetical protein